MSSCGRTIVAIMSFFVSGCAEMMSSQPQHYAPQSWDAWIGTTRDDRVKDLGIPTRCYVFQSKAEACEWSILLPTKTGTVTLEFDAKGQVCQWTYRDSFEIRRSQSHCT